MQKDTLQLFPKQQFQETIQLIKQIKINTSSSQHERTSKDKIYQASNKLKQSLIIHQKKN